MRETLYELQIVGAVGVAAFGQCAAVAVNLVGKPLQVVENFGGLAAYGRVVGQLHDLGQIAHGGAVVDGYASGRRPLQSGQNLKQGRFSGTVSAHKGYALLRVDDEGEVAE